MKTVEQMLEGKGRRLLSVAPGATVYEALKLMAEHEVGALGHRVPRGGRDLPPDPPKPLVPGTSQRL